MQYKNTEEMWAGKEQGQFPSRKVIGSPSKSSVNDHQSKST